MDKTKLFCYHHYMDLADNLKRLGFSEKEALVYTKALEVNSFSIAGMARLTSIKRPTCYLIVDNLIQKGLITLLPRGRKSLYCAEDPETILRNMERVVDLAKLVIPKLQQIKVKDVSSPTIKFFTGRRGVETIYNDVLKEKEGSVLFSMTPARQIVDVVGEDFFRDWIRKRIDRKIISRVLVPEKDKNKQVIVKTNDEEMRETRYLPKNFSIDTTFGLYNDKVAFFSSQKDNIGFIIKSNEFSQTIRNFFEYLWDSSSK